MRHRAARSLINLVSRLPRATARPLGALAELSPVRAVAALVLALGVWAGGFVAVASVGEGYSRSPGHLEALGERSAPTPSRGGERPSVGTGAPSRRAEGGTLAPSRQATEDAGRTGAPGRTKSPPSRSAENQESGSRAVSSPAPGEAEPDGATSSAAPEDYTPPDTSLSTQFPDGDAAVFSFSADEPATFACSLDGTAYGPCDSPASYSSLHSGWHTFTVRATDAAGNVDPDPAEATWHANAGQPPGHH